MKFYLFLFFLLPIIQAMNLEKNTFQEKKPLPIACKQGTKYVSKLECRLCRANGIAYTSNNHIEAENHYLTQHKKPNTSIATELEPPGLYTCNFPSCTFQGSVQALRLHKTIAHISSGTSMCNYCQRSFKGVLLHMRTAHDNFVYQCTACSLILINSTQFAKHKKEICFAAQPSSGISAIEPVPNGNKTTTTNSLSEKTLTPVLCVICEKSTHDLKKHLTKNHLYNIKVKK